MSIFDRKQHDLYLYLKGILNFFIYVGAIYYFESLKHGINLLNYIFDRRRLIMRRENQDKIDDEDDDVKKERLRVQDSYIEVLLLNKCDSWKYWI